MGRSRLARLGFAVVAGLLAVGVLSAPAAAAGTGTVQGTFTTSDDTPIAGATVTAYSADQDWLADTTTDQDGHYTLGGVASGGVKLQFDDQGRRQWSPGVGDFTGATLYDLAAGGTLTVDEHQLATGKLAGHFTDGSGAGFPIFVTVQSVGDPPAYLNTTADEDGAWSIDVLPGVYQVSFQWDSVTQWAVQQTSEDAADTYTVAAGATVTVDDHKLPTGTAGGRLTTAAGDPLVSADVSLHLDGRTIGGATTDDDGQYSFGEVLAGDGYTVSFSVNGGADQWVSGTLDPAQARQFTITAGENTTIDDTQLSTAEVHGRLVDTGGSPQAGYHVSVTLDDDNGVQYDADTDQDGKWSVSGVFPGNYRVSFASPGWERTQYAYGKGSSTDAALIAIGGGASVTVDDTWLPGADLVVNAVDATTGAPVSDFCVWVDSPGDGSGCTTGSQVTVGDLPGGAFHVSVDPDETTYYLNSDSVPVSLTAGKTTTVTVPLTLGGKAAVTATSHETGSALRGACGVFKVLGQGGLPDGYGDCTDQTGKMTTITMAAGTYEMFAVAPAGYGYQWVGPHGGTGDQRAAARIKIKPGATVQAPTVLLDRPGTITGVLSDSAGKPIADGDVAYSAWGDAGPEWDTSTDAKGHYTLDKLGPYAWPLLFSGGGAYPRQWSGHQGDRFKAQAVPVVAGGSTTYDFTMRATSTLKGTVTSPSNNWRINIANADTGDQMGVFDSSAAGAGGSYSLPLVGGQQVKVRWSYYVKDVTTQGWYNHATDIAHATKVAIPANGSRKLNLVLR